VVLNVLIERHLLGAVPAAPPALAVARLIDDDAVHPRAQAGVAAEGVDGPEDAQKDFLRQVEGFVVVVEEVQRQLVDHPLVLADELRAGVLVPSGAPLDQGGFPAADVGPGYCPNGFHGELSAHSSTAPVSLRYRPAGNVPSRATLATMEP
jgi:hypothetical protein